MDPPPAAPLSRWRLPGGHVLCATVLVSLVAAPEETRFTTELPGDVPNVSLWTKVSGSAELADGTASVQYEMYVNPAGSGGYELIRYRITGWDGGRGGPPYSSNERLQWQAAQKDLRRYECEAHGPYRCVWRQLGNNTIEYHREMPVILWVLGLHQSLLESRPGQP